MDTRGGPQKDLMQMDSRVLALYGSKDQQVHAEPNAGALDAAFREAGKKNDEICHLENANHIFQKAVAGGVAEYSKLPSEFTAGYLEAITAWVLRESPCSSAGVSESSQHGRHADPPFVSVTEDQPDSSNWPRSDLT